MKKLFTLLVLGSLFALGFYNSKKPIVQQEDIRPYLQAEYFNHERSTLLEQVNFWAERLADQATNSIYQQKLASLQAQYFRLSGEVQFLRSSDSLLLDLARRFPNTVANWQGLAQNAITGHEFAKADRYINQALAIGEKRYQSSLIKVDVLLERGARMEALGLLNGLGNSYKFEYLTRQVKLQDELGELEDAIVWMEKAVGRAKTSGDSSLVSWSLANLADMYGHQGKIKKSYNTFLQALQYNPAELHALKGIAWIAFSHDKAPTLAKGIIEFLQSLQDVPDYDLLLADIATYQQDFQQAAQYTGRFLDRASKEIYGFLYTRPLAERQMASGQLEENDGRTKAEIDQRAHPLSYALRAQYLHERGSKDAAIKLLEEKVLGQTEEPDALYLAGMVFKQNGKTKEAKALLKAAREAAFELGPIAEIEIKNALKGL
ncbi:MAG: hypothetical protein HRU41_12930 [Saprospiraceae bacterium]|nr:hypothetical protein [Saprospiraceae bacterium]